MNLGYFLLRFNAKKQGFRRTLCVRLSVLCGPKGTLSTLRATKNTT